MNGMRLHELQIALDDTRSGLNDIGRMGMMGTTGGCVSNVAKIALQAFVVIFVMSESRT